MRASLLLLMAIVACSDSGGPPSSVMTALIQGKPFTAENPPEDYIALLDTATSALNVAGTRSISSNVYDNLGLSIPHFHGTGRYLTCAVTGSVLASFPDSATVFYFLVDERDTLPPSLYETAGGCGLGEIDVLAYDRGQRTIAGAFHVVLVGDLDLVGDTLHVTDGQFHGRITFFPSAPPFPDTVPTARAEHR